MWRGSYLDWRARSSQPIPCFVLSFLHTDGGAKAVIALMPDSGSKHHEGMVLKTVDLSEVRLLRQRIPL